MGEDLALELWEQKIFNTIPKAYNIFLTELLKNIFQAQRQINIYI